jgi:hypothetical protein
MDSKGKSMAESKNKISEKLFSISRKFLEKKLLKFPFDL